MPSVWRAADLPPSDRVDAFVEVMSDSVVPYGDPARIALAAGDEVRTARVGTLRVMNLVWTGGAATRASTQIHRSDPELCKIDVSLSGAFAVDQSGRQAALDAGTFTFVDLSRPHRVAARHCQMTAVMFPRSLLPLRDRDIDDLTGVTFDRTQPGVGLVTSVVREMVADLGAYEGPTGARLGGAVLDLISVTLAGRLDRCASLPAEARRRALVLRIRTFIEDNLGDPQLAPGVVAARHHISPRQLHKIFQDQGTTVAELIRSRRLERCRHDLLDPGRAGAPVGAVAVRWGFRDPAYFNRVFRARFGVPPGQYRLRHVTTSGVSVGAGRAP